ncbi:MAG: calcium-binding protein [Sterolibacterium sp.]
MMADIDLYQDNFHLQYADHLTVPQALQGLPNLEGIGRLRDLREAATLSTELADVLARFSAAETHADQKALIADVLIEWAKTDPSYTSAGVLFHNGAGGGFYDSNSNNIIYYSVWGVPTRNVPSDDGISLSSASVDRIRFIDAVRSAHTTEIWNVGISNSLEDIGSSFDYLSETIYESLLTQTRLKKYLDSIVVSLDGNNISFDFSALTQLITSRSEQDPLNAIADLHYLNKLAGNVLEQLGWKEGTGLLGSLIRTAPESETRQSLLADLKIRMVSSNASATSADDTLYSGDGPWSINAGAGNDTVVCGAVGQAVRGEQGDDALYGGSGNDTLSGDGGNDKLSGGAGNDVLRAAFALTHSGMDYSYQENDANTLEGGVGDDRLYGGGGADTYRYSLGDGADTIYETYYHPDTFVTSDTASDKIVLDAGITPNEVSVIRNSGDLILKFANSVGDQITISNWYDAAKNRIEQVVFADGTTWDRATLHAAGLVVEGTSAADLLRGFGNEGDQLYGNTGNDTLMGYGGSDTLVGGVGDDMLRAAYISAGGIDFSPQETDANTLEGGAGNDQLYGGAGSDDYLYNPGDGADTIHETGYVSFDGFSKSDTATDRIILGTGITAEDVMVSRSGTDLILKFIDSDDQVTLSGWYNTSGSRIEQLVFDDGTVWNRATLNAAGLLQQGTPAAETLRGLSNEDDVIDGLGGNDQLFGSTGNDVYLFGSGSGQDTINENDGTLGNVDTIRFKAGISPESVTFAKVSSALVLSVSGTTDTITVANWFNGAQYRIERIEFLDGADNTPGTAWTTEEIDQAIEADNPNVAPVLANSLADQVTYENIPFAFTLPANMFTDGNVDDQLTYSTKLGNGDTLPVWLHFAAGLRQFSGIAVTDALGLWVLSVTATDPAGESASGTFVLVVAHHVPGSDANDVLNGTASLDMIEGQAGDDTLSGSQGGDTLKGGVGSDVYVIDDATYTLIEPYGEGLDIVRSSVSHALGTNLDYLELTGNEAIDGTGNGLDNLLTGNAADNRLSGEGGADTLDGGEGADTLVGGAGNDMFVVDDDGDVILEDANGGKDTVRASLSYTLGADIESLILTGMDALDGTGNALDNFMIGNTAANRLEGGAGNDTLNGRTGADTLSGGPGDDTYVVDNIFDRVDELVNQGLDVVNASVSFHLPENIEDLVLTGRKTLTGTGNALDNRLTGNASANTLDGGVGADTLSGGLGNDVYCIDNAGDVVIENEGEGVDMVQSRVSYALGADLENLTLLGDASLNGSGNQFDNNLKGNAGANQLAGAQGNDTLDGGGGADTLTGGTGNDLYWVNDAGDQVVEAANEGIDGVMTTTSHQLADNVEKLTLSGTMAINGTGNVLNNLLIGNAAGNRLNGGLGKDTLKGGGGTDTLAGGAGDDVYVVSDAEARLIENSGEGLDTVQSTVDYALGANLERLSLLGTAALNATGNELDNQLTGNPADNQLIGGGGNDILNGGAGADTLVGGAGNDVYIIDNSGDVVLEYPDEGIDTVQSTRNYTLGDNLENLGLTGSASNAVGNALDNRITGNSGNNLLTGLHGNDTLNGGPGADTLSGGAGDDSYMVDDRADRVVEADSAGEDVVYSTVSYSLPANVEHLSLMGSAQTEGSGNDLDNQLTGNAGANTLNGGAGEDTLNGKSGSDRMSGGTGDDIYHVDNPGDVVIENLAEGKDTLMSSVGRALDANVENLILLGTASLSASGNAGNNLLRGNAGVNTLDGQAGTDFLEGLAGNDQLTDILGRNYLNGGAGNDQLSAGPGNDLVIGGSGNDEVNAGDGWNVIAFNRGDGNDTISFDSSARDTISLGNGIAHADLYFRKKGYDLLLDTGRGEGMTFKNFYVAASGNNDLYLQIVTESMVGYAASSVNPWLQKKIQGYDLSGLIAAFDTARAATPTITSWALRNALDQCRLFASDDSAYGGDLVYQYGRNGTLSGFELTAAEEILSDPPFASQIQVLHPFYGFQDGLTLMA